VASVRGAGFALVDVLVALLLLAIVITGACATLIHTMRVTRDALLATEAVDLAADLAEELRTVGSITQARELLPAWRERVRRALPVAGLGAEDLATLVLAGPVDDPGGYDGPGRHEVRLRWRASTAGGMRELILPVTIPFEAAQAR
jgi:type II secretory pathway pseudopilin PulG